jgi:hypothetical protein
VPYLGYICSLATNFPPDRERALKEWRSEYRVQFLALLVGVVVFGVYRVVYPGFLALRMGSNSECCGRKAEG